MKTKFLFYCLLIISPLLAFCQGSWTQKANYPLAGRQYPCGFSINGLGYYAFGCGLGFTNSINLVEYNPTTNTWTQKANFPGGARLNAHVFVIDTIAYIVSGAYWSGGSGNYTSYSDVWAYNPYNNSWTQKNNFPGTPRHGGFAYSYDGKGYFGLGVDNNLNFLNDFWKYNPITDTWIQKTSFPGANRKNGFQFSIDKCGYIGMGYDASLVAHNDVWRYDSFTDSWTQMSNFPGSPRCWLSSFSMYNKGYIVTGYLLNSSVSTNEFWEYNAGLDTWTSLPAYSGGARYTGAGFSVNGKAYNGLGYNSTYLNDFWEYTPTVYTGTDFIYDKIAVNIFPNPAKEQFMIEIPRLPKNSNNIVIVDATLRKVLNLQINGNPQILTVDCASWRPGKYFVVLFTGKEKVVKPIVIL